jgi:hypothetical protein
MNDRELLEFIAAQVGNLTAKFNNLETKVNNLETKVNQIGNQVTVIESEHGKKLDILFEEVVNVKEKLIEHDSRFDNIESKIEFQDFEIKVLKRVK